MALSIAYYASLTILFAQTLAFPTSQLKDISQLSNLEKKFEIVEGPREFFVPVVPIRDLVFPRTAEKDLSKLASSVSKPSDLDYMVYGKLYLMKSLNTANQASEHKEENNDNSRFRIYVPQTQATPKPQYEDGISFPLSTKPVKRPYHYKVWSNMQTFDKQSNNPELSVGASSVIDHKSGHSDHRKLEERSVDQREIPENPVSLIDSTTTDSTTTIGESVKADNSSFDEEAITLFKKLFPQVSLIEETFEPKNDTDAETPGNATTSNSTTDDIDIEDRFLINVPTKPNFLQCPPGQKRTHRGVCKPVFVPKPSPHDGFFAGRIYAANGTQRREQNSASLHGQRDDNPNLQWTTLFRSVVQLERRLEKAIKESEKQITAIIEDDHNSSSVTTDKTKLE